VRRLNVNVDATRTLRCCLHSLRRGNSENRQAVANHYPRRQCKHEPRVHDSIGLTEHMMLVIPLMGEPGGVQQVRCYTMRLERLRRTTHKCGEIQQSREQFNLHRLGEQRQGCIRRRYRCQVYLANSEDAAHAGMCHLDVVNGILLRLRPRQVNVEHELRIALSHEEEVPYRISTNLVDQVAHSDVAACTLGDLHLFSATSDGDHLVQYVFGIAFWNPHAERLQSGAHPRGGTMMIGTL